MCLSTRIFVREDVAVGHGGAFDVTPRHKADGRFRMMDAGDDQAAALH